MKRIKEKLIVATLCRLRGIVKVGFALGYRCDVERMIQISTKYVKMLSFCNNYSILMSDDNFFLGNWSFKNFNTTTYHCTYYCSRSKKNMQMNSTR